jgi:aspartyl-tRNA(Asn)/glutamyl-tRNA(Gln) amidotransferase subunit A
MELWELDLTSARNKLHTEEITSVELTQSCLNRIKQVDDDVKAFISVFEDEALAQAKQADQMLKSKEAGLLTGIPFSVKDVIMTDGQETTAASNILKGYRAVYSATSVQKILDQGGVLLGKVNCDAFAHGASTENSDFPTTRNPWDLDRVPGGSSGGSAAAVAAGMGFYSLGTDTGGSIRQPAGFTNTVGFKPTYGRVSRYGLISMTSSTDCLSVITKDVNDAAAVLEVIAGEDVKDATTIRVPTADYLAKIKHLLPEGLKIGIPRDLFEQGMSDDVKDVTEKAIDAFKELGVEIVDITLPTAALGVAAYYIITPSELSSNLERFDGIRYGYSATTDEAQNPEDLFEVYTKTRGKGFGNEAKRRIMMGTHALSSGYYDAYYKKASKVRTLIKQDFDTAFESVDLILTPTAPGTAFKVGEKAEDPLSMYLEDIFLAAVSLAGLPAISVPAGFGFADESPDKKLPIGIQLISKPFQESLLFRTARVYEEKNTWSKERPAL